MHAYGASVVAGTGFHRYLRPRLETLRAAMPTPDEKRLVASRVYDGVAHASALELDRLDAALIKTKLGTLSMPSSPIDPNKRAYGNAQDAADSAPLSPSAWERLHCEDIMVAAAHGAASVLHTVLPPDRATRLARLRAAFVADQLAPAEKFVFAVVECEAQLATFAGTATPDCAAAARGAVPSLLSSRLDALVTALGADHALGAVAERADAYADCAAKVMRSRALAKLLRPIRCGRSQRRLRGGSAHALVCVCVCGRGWRRCTGRVPPV